MFTTRIGVSVRAFYFSTGSYLPVKMLTHKTLHHSSLSIVDSRKYEERIVWIYNVHMYIYSSLFFFLFSNFTLHLRRKMAYWVKHQYVWRCWSRVWENTGLSTRRTNISKIPSVLAKVPAPASLRPTSENMRFSYTNKITRQTSTKIRNVRVAHFSMENLAKFCTSFCLYRFDKWCKSYSRFVTQP